MKKELKIRIIQNTYISISKIFRMFKSKFTYLLYGWIGKIAKKYLSNLIDNRKYGYWNSNNKDDNSHIYRSCSKKREIIK